MTTDLSTQTLTADPVGLPQQRATGGDLADRRFVRRGRPRSVPGEEAYLRSELERAAIDIAAGW